MYSQSHFISCYGIDKSRLYFPVSRNSRSFKKRDKLACLLLSKAMLRCSCASICILHAHVLANLFRNYLASAVHHPRGDTRRASWNLEAMARLLVPRDILVASSASSCLRVRRAIPRRTEGLYT